MKLAIAVGLLGAAAVGLIRYLAYLATIGG